MEALKVIIDELDNDDKKKSINNKDEDGKLKISSNNFNTQIYDAIKNTIHSENKDFEGLRQELFKTEEEKAVSNRTEQKLKGFNSIEELTDFRKTNADIYLSNKINELETQQVKLPTLKRI